MTFFELLITFGYVFLVTAAIVCAFFSATIGAVLIALCIVKNTAKQITKKYTKATN